MKLNISNKKIMAKLLTSAYLFLAASAVTMFSVESMANNGTGYGGADFVTKSIPKEFDKAILVSYVDMIQYSCQARLVVPVLKDMCNRLHKSTDIIKEYKEYEYLQNNEYKCRVNHMIALWSRFISHSTDELSVKSIYEGGFELTAKASILKINHSDIITTGSYDDFGRYEPSKNRIKKITLNRVPDNYFVNTKSGKATNFLLPNERLADCLESELQKLVDKQEQSE